MWEHTERDPDVSAELCELCTCVRMGVGLDVKACVFVCLFGCVHCGGICICMSHTLLCSWGGPPSDFQVGEFMYIGQIDS